MNYNVISNFIWRLMERFGAHGVTFVVSIILARLLDPSVYGIVAIVTVFTTILQVFVDSGLGNALIQKKNADNLDFSSVFYFNIVVCVILYALMFLCSPFIAEFYSMPELTPIVRVMSLTLIISGVKNIQQAYVAKNLIFKKFFFSTLAGTIGAAFVGIFLAYKGYGVWALVCQNIFNQLVDTIILWVTVKWRPNLIFSFKRLKCLLLYGSKLLASALLDTTYNQIYKLIIGKKYTSEDLAFYEKGEIAPYALSSNFCCSMDSILLPVMSEEQDDRVKVKEITRKSIKLSTYILMPIMMGIAVCAEPIIKLVLTEKWIECVPFLRVFCFIYAFYPVHTSNLSAIKAIGRSDIFFKLEILKKVVGIITILITMWYGVKWIAYGSLFTSVLCQFINAFPNKKLLNYGYLQQLKDMLPQLLLSSVMGAIVFSLSFLNMNYAFLLIIQVIVGIIIYILGSWILKIDSFYCILEKIKNVKIYVTGDIIE